VINIIFLQRGMYKYGYDVVSLSLCILSHGWLVGQPSSLSSVTVLVILCSS